MKHLLPLLIVLSIFTACGDNERGAENTRGTEEQPATHSIDLTAYDMPLVVDLDQNMLVSDTAEVHWNEEFGVLEVRAGERFHITISEEDPDLQRLKADLERDMLRKHTIIEESPSLVIYRSEFPDEDLVFNHFYRVVENDGRTFVITSHDQGRFNESDIRRMASAVSAAHRV